MKAENGLKTCNRCKVTKSISDYNKNKKHPDGLYPLCKDCRKQYAAANKEKIKLQKQNHYINNKEEVRKKQTEYYVENAESIRWHVKQYSKDNPDKIRESKRIYIKSRKKKDPVFKIKQMVSCSIGNIFRHKKISKDKGVWRHLPYTPEQLKEHLEKQFEPWMSWENHGILDNNKRTWQIDHIIPQSMFVFKSVKDENFLKCWSLNNLQPLEALANIKKGNKLIK